MSIELLEGESLVKEGAANLQRGAETVGGKLYLTNQRLLFKSHAFNIQTGETQVALAEISRMELVWTRFLNLVPLFPNSLAVWVGDKEYRFVLYGREAWKQAIESQRG